MMSLTRRSPLTILLIGLAVVALALPSAAQVKFRGRYLTGGGGTIEPVLTVNIEVLAYSTPEEISELVKALTERGESAFHETFRSMKKGSLQVISGRGLKIEFHAAREYPSDKGMKIEMIGENGRFELGTLQRPSSGLEVLVCIMEIDERGRGEARIYEDATFQILPDGSMTMDRHNRAPKIITGLTQYKLKEPKKH
jgi:hypothetical protein